MRSLKILHVVYSFGIGGSETVASEIASRMQQYGHSNMMVALEHDGPLSAEMRAQSIQTRVVDRANKSMIAAMKDIVDICKEFRPDVIHTHHMYMLFYTVPAALRLRVPLVHTEHEFWSLNNRKGRLFMPVLGRFCGYITAVNDDTRDFMGENLHLQRKKLETVLNGIDLRRFNKETSLNRADIGLSESDKVAGIVARLEAVKNHSLLIRAWSGVVERVPEAKLLIIGEGGLDASLREQAEKAGLGEKVVFLGPRRDVSEILPLLDAAVLSSRDEGLPMFLLEGMASELPVVATSVGGVPKLVEERVNGLLVKDDDEVDMARAITDIFANGDLARNLGQSGVALVREKYSLESSAGRYQEMYYELAGS